MLDGIYSITFRGLADWGMGMIVMRDGHIVGADVAGVLYDGIYEETGTNVRAKFTMTVPPGATLVQGTPARPVAYTVQVDENIPASAFKDGHSVTLKLPPGPVNVIFRRLRPLTA